MVDADPRAAWPAPSEAAAFLTAWRGGRLQIGTVAAFNPESWPASDRNGGRLQVGKGGRLQLESALKLLQIVLTGQEELAEKVKRYRELRSRMIPIAINSMSPTDLQDMLRFRWSVASGTTSQAPFTNEAFQEIFAYTKGLPRDAIKLSDEVLRHLFVSQKQHAAAAHVVHAAQQLDLEK